MDSSKPILEYDEGRERCTLRIEQSEKGFRLSMPPLTFGDHCVITLITSGVIGAMMGIGGGVLWLIGGGTLHDSSLVLDGVYFLLAGMPLALFSWLLPARRAVLEIDRDRVIVTKYGWLGRYRREWVTADIRDVEFRNWWGVYALGDGGRTLFTVTTGRAANLKWLARELSSALDAVGRAGQAQRLKG